MATKLTDDDLKVIALLRSHHSTENPQPCKPKVLEVAFEELGVFVRNGERKGEPYQIDLPHVGGLFQVLDAVARKLRAMAEEGDDDWEAHSAVLMVPVKEDGTHPWHKRGRGTPEKAWWLVKEPKSLWCPLCEKQVLEAFGTEPVAKRGRA